MFGFSSQQFSWKIVKTINSYYQESDIVEAILNVIQIDKCFSFLTRYLQTLTHIAMLFEFTRG